MSGESRSARPAGSAGVGTSWSDRPARRCRPSRAAGRGGSGRPRTSARRPGWQASTGARVVGRSTPAGADDGADEAVHERRLARAGRAADDDQRGRLHLPQTREEVVVHLGDEVVAHASRLLRARDLELEPDRAEVVAQAVERLGEVGAHLASPTLSATCRRCSRRLTVNISQVLVAQRDNAKSDGCGVCRENLLGRYPERRPDRPTPVHDEPMVWRLDPSTCLDPQFTSRQRRTVTGRCPLV